MTLESLIEADRLLTECKIAWGRVERVIDDDGEVYRPFNTNHVDIVGVTSYNRHYEITSHVPKRSLY